MRGMVPGLINPHPLGRGLPGVYQEEDPFTMRMTEALDEVLAPVVSTLDNLPAYFDPHLAPEDFVGWLAGWVAFELDETWPIATRREAVARAVDLLQRRGTAGGLADEITLVTGGEAEIVENGGTAWSLDPGSEMVGSRKPSLLVRVRVKDAAAVDAERLDRIVRAAKPAHVPHRVEVIGGDAEPKARRKPTPDASSGQHAKAEPTAPPPEEGADG